MADTIPQPTQTLAPLEPPLTLTPPAPVAVVAPNVAAGLVPVSTEIASELDRRADAEVAKLAAADANSPEFGRLVESFSNIGRAEIADAARQSNRFLDRPVRQINDQGGIGANLTELRRTVEDLDPSRRGNLTTQKRLFGLIPMGGKLRNYFDSYKSSQSNIQKILTGLAGGKDELMRDNAAIDVERQAMWAAMGRLEQMIHVSKTLDAKLESKSMELETSDPAKSTAIKQTALFYVRQRTTDLLTQQAVTVQGYLALDLVKKNNIELIKGVDRASTTTVSALRTAVTVAQAMTNQRLVLEQITALNTTTANIIDATGELLKSQTAKIHEQAAGSTIPLETLKRAFQNIYQTMDAIDQFKLKALDNMKATVDALSGEVEKSRGYIARAQGSGTAGSLPSADSPFAAITAQVR